MADGINMNRRNFLRSMVGLGAVSVFPKEAFAVSGGSPFKQVTSPEMKKVVMRMVKGELETKPQFPNACWKVCYQFEFQNGKARFIEYHATLENIEEMTKGWTGMAGCSGLGYKNIWTT